MLMWQSEKRLHGQQQAADSAGQQGFLQVALPGAAVGLPPIAGLVAQRAQDRVVQADDLRRGDHAAQHARDDERNQRVGLDGEPDTGGKRQTAEHRQYAGQPDGGEVAAQNLKKAGSALLQGASGDTPGPGLSKLRVKSPMIQ